MQRPHCRFTQLLMFVFIIAACGGDKEPEPAPTGLFGSATLHWRLLDLSAAEISCNTAGVAKVVAGLGGTPQMIACSEATSVTFENLQSGAYPVFIQLLDSQDEVLTEHLGNLEIERGQTTMYQHDFAFDLAASEFGNITLSWRINGNVATPEECARFGGVTVQIVSESASIDPTVQTSAACEDTVVRLEGLRTGYYLFTLSLVDADGMRVGLAKRAELSLKRGEDHQASPVSFDNVGVDYSQLWATWTVLNATSTTGCSQAGGDIVSVRVVRPASAGSPNSVVIATATSSCEQGQLTIPEIYVGSTYFNVSFELIDSLSTVIATGLERNVQFFANETSTVSHNFVPTR